MTKVEKTVTQELQTALVALESAEAIYHEKTGSTEFTDVLDACQAIERALTKIQHARAKATAAIDEF